MTVGNDFFLLLVRTPGIEGTPAPTENIPLYASHQSMEFPPPPTSTTYMGIPCEHFAKYELCSLSILLHVQQKAHVINTCSQKGQLIKVGVILIICSQSSNNYLDNYSHSTVGSSLL